MTILNRLLQSVREIIFGLEDGLVSTLGVITGVAEGTNSQSIVILTGLVVISVESISMAAGTFLSNKSENQMLLTRLKSRRQKTHFVKDHFRELNRKPLQDSIFMFVSYFLGGSVPLLPYFLLPPSAGLAPSIILTIITLFIIGFAKGKAVNTSPLRSGLEMVIVASSAAAVGFLVGKLFSQQFTFSTDFLAHS